MALGVREVTTALAGGAVACAGGVGFLFFFLFYCRLDFNAEENGRAVGFFYCSDFQTFFRGRRFFQAFFRV